MDNKVSIIIRTKNEERWISSCLKAVFSQNYKNFEVIVVDNCSTDKTVEKAKKFPIKLVNIEHFLPGKAINLGIENSIGEYIVCLSGHCVPVDEVWLEELIKNLDDPKVAGVYGRQEPLAYTSDLDKRDLLTTFGLDERVQIKDSFFHNANSAFRREIWDSFPFDEKTTNIEDRLWGEKVILNRLKIIYKPTASVYHWHGIHHDLNPSRANNIVKILESMETINFNNFHTDPASLESVVIIPLKGISREFNNIRLLDFTISNIRKSKYVDKIIVSTDSNETTKYAQSLGIDIVINRPKRLSEKHISVFDVLKYSVDYIESHGIHPDIVVMMEEVYPFRNNNIIDQVISQLLYSGNDTIVSSVKEDRDMWYQTQENHELNLSSDAFIPKAIKHESLLSAPGFCSATYVEHARDKSLFDKKLGLFKIENPISSIAINKDFNQQIALELFKVWNNINE